MPICFCVSNSGFLFLFTVGTRYKESNENVVSYFILVRFAVLFYYVLSPLFLKVNDVNIQHVPTSTPLAYGLVLLDILFTRAELKKSIHLYPKKAPS